MNPHLQPITQLRIATLALQNERDALQSQTRSRAEVRTYIDNYIARCEEQAVNAAARCLRNLAFGHAAPILRASTSLPGPMGNIDVELTHALAGVMGADKVRKFLLAGIDAVPEGLDRAARLERLEAIASELDELEGEEERLIEQSEDDGQPVPRRATARPEIVLGPKPQKELVYDERKYNGGISTTAAAAPHRMRAVSSSYLTAGRSDGN